MAKKKLTPFEKAQRQFVQARLAETGLEASPETRQRFRQRFETLAAEKQGRTKLAQKLLPTGAPEERKNFKRMLATDLPARGDTGGTGGTGGGSTSSYKVPTAKDITAGWQQAVKSGSYKVPTPATKAPTVSTQQTSTTSSKSKGNVFTNRRENIIGKGINYPGRTFVEGVTNPFGNVGAIKDWSPKGLVKVAGQELGEAASVVSSAQLTGMGLKAVSSVGRFGLKGLAKLFPKLGDASINRSGGVGKVPYGPSVPPAPSSPVSAATSAGRSTAATRATTLRLNAKGGYGSKPYGPQVPASTKAPTSLPKGATNRFGGVGSKPYGPARPAGTKPATTKPATTKPATSKPASTKGPKISKADEAKIEAEFGKPKLADVAPKATTKKGPKISKADAEDIAYQAAQAKNRFPGATDKDMPFIQKLNRAQQAIENKSAGYQSYANWLKNPQTQSTLARLRRK